MKKKTVTSSEMELAARQLADECRARRLVVFVGAGASLAAGLPDWPSLLQELLAAQSIRTKEPDPLLVAHRLEKAMGPLPFREAVAERLRCVDRPSDVHCALATLPADLYLTTNYDHLLEDALRDARHEVQVARSGADLPSIRPGRKTVVKLHGDLDSPHSLVLTSRDYGEYEDRNREMSEYLRARSVDRTLLFVGTSFRDPHLRAADDSVLRRFGRFRRAPYIALLGPGSASASAPGGSARVRAKRASRVERDDFDAYCDELSERGFRVVVLPATEDVPRFLRDITKLAAEGPQPGLAMTCLAEDRVEVLQRQLRNAQESRCRELLVLLRGDDEVPAPPRAELPARARALTGFLSAEANLLSPELRVEAWCTLANTLALLDASRHQEARRCYEQALVVAAELAPGAPGEQQLERTRARLAWAEGNRAEAIACLDPDSDPKTASLWLSMLLDAGREEDALPFLAHHQPDPAWVAVAGAAEATVGDLDRARELRRQALERLNPGNQAGKARVDLLMAHGLLRRALRMCGVPAGGRGYVLSILPAAEDLAREAVELAEPIAGASALGDYLVQARLVVMQAGQLLRDRGKTLGAAAQLIAEPEMDASVAVILSTWLEVSQTAALLRSGSWPDQLRAYDRRLHDNHPNELWALICRAGLAWKVRQDPGAACEILTALRDASGSDEERRHGASMLYNAAAEAGRLDAALDLIRQVLPPGDPFFKIHEAQVAVFGSDYETGLRLLREVESAEANGPLLPQIEFLKGWIAGAVGRWADARTHMEKVLDSGQGQPAGGVPDACEALLRIGAETNDPALILRTARQMRAWGLENDHSRFLQAQAMAESGHVSEAEQALRELLGNDPARSEYALVLARLLVLLGRPEEAAGILVRFCQDDHDQRLDGRCVAVRADILLSLGQAPQALQELLPLASGRLGEDPGVVMACMDAAYRAGDDRAAHQMLRQLERLKDQGRVSDDEFRRFRDIKDVIALMSARKESIDQARQSYRNGEVMREVLASLEGNGLALDWAIRTQELPPGSPAVHDMALVIYATDGFRLARVAGQPRALPLAVPDRQDPSSPNFCQGNALVIDYDALVTIDRLSLLEAVARRFERVYYHQRCPSLWLQEQKELQAIQRSRERAVRRICHDLDTGRLRAASPMHGSTTVAVTRSKTLALARARLAAEQGGVLVDPFTDLDDVDLSGAVVVGIRAVADWLYRRGWVSQKALERIREIQGDRRPASDDGARAALEAAQTWVVEPRALEALYDEDILAAICDKASKQVCLLAADAGAIRRYAGEFGFRDEVREWQEGLTRRALPSLPVFEPADSQTPLPTGLDLPDKVLLALLTMRLAEEKIAPLCTDDRYKQRLFDSAHPGLVFGTDALLADLAGCGLISRDKYAEAFLQLCRWRYRFLVPPAKLLLELARRYPENPPGDEALQLARYMRDSMEDPGLPQVLVPGDPPLPCWYVYWRRFEDSLVGLLLGVWADERTFNTAAAQQLTRWVWQEALPPFPAGIDLELVEKTRDVVDRYRLVVLLLDALEKRVGHRAVDMIKETLCALYSDEKRPGRLDEALADALEVIWARLPADNRNRATIRHLFRRWLGWSFELGPKVKASLAGMGFDAIAVFDTTAEETQEPADLERALVGLERLWDPAVTYESSDSLPPGPLKVVEVGQDRVVQLPHVLVEEQDHRQRQGGLDLVLHPPLGESPWVTEQTARQLEALRDRLLSPNEGSWGLAGGEACAAMLGDYRYCHAATRQLLATPTAPQAQAAVSELLESLLRPRPETIQQELPKPLAGPWDPRTMSTSAGELLSKLPERNLVACCLEATGLVLLGGPLATERLIVGRLMQAAKGDPKAAASQALPELWDEIRDSRDPLVVRAGIGAMLALRPFARQDDLFAPETFDPLLLMLLAEFEGPGQDARHAARAAAWRLVLHLARYYTDHLSLQGRDVFPDLDHRLAVGWWLAWKFGRSILEVCETLDVGKPEAYLEHLREALEQRVIWDVRVRRLFEGGPVGRARAQLEGSERLLAGSTVSMMAPPVPFDGEGHPAFDGLLRPTTVLAPEVRDAIIDLAFQSAVHGGAALARPPQDDASSQRRVVTRPWCEDPPCLSGPRLLKSYYGDALRYLGSARLERLASAEAMSEEVPPSQWLHRLRQTVGAGNDAEALWLCRLFGRWASGGDQAHVAGAMSDEDLTALATLVERQPAVLRWLTDSAAVLFLSGRADEGGRLLSVVNASWPDHLPDELAGALAWPVTLLGLLGAPRDIWERRFSALMSSPSATRELGKVKRALRQMFLHIPPRGRDRARLVMTLLANVAEA